MLTAIDAGQSVEQLAAYLQPILTAAAGGSLEANCD